MFSVILDVGLDSLCRYSGTGVTSTRIDISGVAINKAREKISASGFKVIEAMFLIWTSKADLYVMTEILDIS